MVDFVIELDKYSKKTVLKQYTGPGGDVVIPERIDIIQDRAFDNAKPVTSIALPDHGITIGRQAFWGIRDSLKSVTVYPCTDASAYADETIIQEGAFFRCSMLESVEFPKGDLNLRETAFMDCTGLKRLVIPGTVSEIDSHAFYGVKNPENITVVLAPEITESSAAVCGGLAKFDISATEKGYAFLTLYQKGTAWQNWRARRKAQNPGAEFEYMREILNAMDPMDYKTGKAVADFLTKYYKHLSPEEIEQVIALYPPKKSKEIAALSEVRGLMVHLGREVADDNPAEAAAEAFVQRIQPHKDALTAVKKGIHWKDSKTLCPREVLVALLSVYAYEWDRCAEKISGDFSDTIVLKNGLLVRNDPEADALADTLDREELSAMLTKLVTGASYRPYLLSWARFASEADISKLTGRFKSFRRGGAKERYLADNMEQALLISPTRAAMQFYDQIEQLDRYAQGQGMTPMELRDTLMMPDLGFDPDGIRRYDIGGNTVEVRVREDLSFSLRDVNKEKEIRSIPKKSDDPAKAEAAAKDFTAFKKIVKEFIKLRSEQLCKMHITAEQVKPELWQKVYGNHPVIRHLAARVVWMDENGVTFTLKNGVTVDALGNSCTPAGCVHIAHVLEMNSDTVAGWQNYFTANGVTQLFEQVWEPVINWTMETMPERYKDVRLSNRERNGLKTNLKRRGVNVHAGESMREFNARAWEYEFSDRNTMHLGKHLKIDYRISQTDQTITFEKATLGHHLNPRELNAVLLELDKASVISRFVEDQGEYLTEDVLAQFSAAQIQAFLDASVESGAVNCSAILLNHKNRHYPQYSAIDQFILEW